ncbi:MAG: S8 family serine peptidase, partial [Nocardioidaceae bacterium]
GVAPGARILNMKVADSQGAVDITQIIAAVDWVVQHRKDAGMNVRVLNLAYGVRSLDQPDQNALSYALDQAWKAGITVVVSAGNDGTTRQSLADPANDPLVVAVGAEDPNNTAAAADDTVPAFAQRGTLLRHVDLIAPGVHVLGLRDPGGSIDMANPGARVGSRFMRGSGTSQAAAVVSGAVALLLQQRPGLTPDQVKGLLRATASPLPLADAAGQGAGEVDLAAASLAPAPAGGQAWAPSRGTGSLEAARGSAHVADGDVELTGERDILGPWNAAKWAAASSDQTSWDGGRWNNRSWTGDCWCGSSWAGRTWSSVSWSGSSWAGRTWAGRTWAGRTWAGRTWAGDGWAGRTWAGRTWAGDNWS